MVYDYLITIKKNNNNNLVDQVSQLMYFFSLVAFGFFYYQSPDSGVIYLFVGGAIILCWVYAIIKKRRTGEAFFRLGLLLSAAGWLLPPHRNIWMVVLYAVAGLIEKQVKFPQEVAFTEDEITFNTLPRKTLKWNEVNNVVIKDGLVTIDQKNNKLFQKEIDGYVTADVENEFNQFSRRCLLKAGVETNKL
jgi:hypothetical protein